MATVFTPPAPALTTPPAELERALAALTAAKQAWADLPISARITILDKVRADLRGVEHRWVAAGMAAKGAQPNTMAEGEEWFALSVLYRLLRYLRKSLVDIRSGGLPRLPGKVCWKQAGTFQVDLLPQSWHDRLALLGVRAEAWIEDRYHGDLPAMAAFYRQQHPEGKVVLVLGAGNVASLGPGDFLQKLFVEGCVVLFKTNPVNAYLGLLLAEG
ncbi:MAG: hypothetical protein WD740_01620, partial [Anaerolineales bacterium]